MKLSAPIFVLKNQAKQLKKDRSIPLHEALDLVARREGFASWSLLQTRSDGLLPSKREEILGYLQPGDLVLVGARPGHGKTSFAIGLFVQAIQESKAKHFLFTLSEVHRDIAGRMAAYDESIGADPSRFELDYSDDINADYVIARTKDSIARGSLIVIDYLQLLDHKRSNPPLQEQVDRLKDYARERECLIVFISQLSRDLETHSQRVPQLRDIKLVNPLRLEVFNKTLLLHRQKPEARETTIFLHRPVEHSLQIDWDPMRIRFS